MRYPSFSLSVVVAFFTSQMYSQITDPELIFLSHSDPKWKPKQNHTVLDEIDTL